MGWKTDDAYDRTRKAEERAMVAALSPRARFRLRVWQAQRLAILGLALAVFVALSKQAGW
ncbi:MAG: hypothetical protein V7704_08355 [Aurantimonas endophytica]|uniref:hypothetical protein n=1 Tax=Aurantimonas endophytica TaxID=1522175 RepID=UPI003001C0FE